MSEINFIFNSNTFTLYNYWDNQPLDILLQGNYADIIRKLSEDQKAQYNLWLSLPEIQKNTIINNADKSRTGDAVVSIKSYPVETLKITDLPNLFSSGKIIAYKILTDKYMQFTDSDDNNYIVYGKYDTATNQVLPHL